MTFLVSLSKDLNSTLINNQSWFIPIDILSLTCLFLTILLALLFLFIILIDETCRTIPMMVVANSCFACLSFTTIMFWATIISFYNEHKQISYKDSFCIFRGYMTYVTGGELFYGYLLQAIYSYMTVVYPTRLIWQSAKFQLFLICLMWASVFICILPILLADEIKYQVDDQICQMVLHLSVVTVYTAFYIYIIPMSGIMFIYLKLVRYVRGMNQRVTPVNTLIRAQRELKMVYRIVIVVMILLILGLPITIFFIIGFISEPPKYHLRIAYIFAKISLLFVMIVLFKFTDSVKSSIMKKLIRRPNLVAPIIA
ncbi:unnamed protein product [Adineta steineri]|uniref:G-protein coupled receptors family 1 profile domain-containing protein n=1 Tax=Adineta steineri TaxID=433720 RepID=A0A814YDU9_9BILA|nr:unnamed protein product [Adineta steineri]CAF1309100.1 unnamed protein product [Adineta steineri]CAF3918036.1 unnamed protein product [Adineta steineri]CAF3969904.1 unnamed protein product [Adineta steineri]